jgi:DNA polymerase V
MSCINKFKNQIFQLKTSTRCELPLYLNPVSAGFPSPADDYLDRNLDLNEHLIGNPTATFFVRACGDSMIGANINDNDILIVDRSISAENGSIIIAALNGELTVKRLKTKAGKLFLIPENDAYPRFEIHEETSFEVWGVVTYIIHKASK